MTRLVPVTATGDLAARSRAACSAAASSPASSGKQRLTRPTRSASAPSIVRAVSASSRATPARGRSLIRLDLFADLKNALPCYTVNRNPYEMKSSWASRKTRYGIVLCLIR